PSGMRSAAMAARTRSSGRARFQVQMAMVTLLSIGGHRRTLRRHQVARLAAAAVGLALREVAGGLGGREIVRQPIRPEESFHPGAAALLAVLQHGPARPAEERRAGGDAVHA